jgi:Tol biopolymer transport system component
VRGNGEIYVARTDGSSARRLTHNPGIDVQPAWQPLRR